MNFVNLTLIKEALQQVLIKVLERHSKTWQEKYARWYRDSKLVQSIDLMIDKFKLACASFNRWFEITQQPIVVTYRRIRRKVRKYIKRKKSKTRDKDMVEILANTYQYV